MSDSDLVFLDAQRKIALLSEMCVILSLPETQELPLTPDAMLGLGLILGEVSKDLKTEVDEVFLSGGE